MLRFRLRTLLILFTLLCVIAPWLPLFGRWVLKVCGRPVERVQQRTFADEPKVWFSKVEHVSSDPVVKEQQLRGMFEEYRSAIEAKAKHEK